MTQVPTIGRQPTQRLLTVGQGLRSLKRDVHDFYADIRRAAVEYPDKEAELEGFAKVGAGVAGGALPGAGAAMQKNELGGTDVSRIVLHDITEREELERVRQDFVANASHELRTPLTIINGYLENLVDDGASDDPEMTKKFLGVMRKHSLAKVTDNKVKLSYRAVHVKPLTTKAEGGIDLQKIEPKERVY